MRRTAIRLVLLFSVVSTGAIVFQNCAKKSGDFVVQSSSPAGPAVSGIVDTPITWGDSPGNGDLSFVDLDPDDNPNNLKICKVAFAINRKSVYSSTDSISFIFATSFKVESNYTIEWSGDSPSGYTKLAEEVTRLQSDLNGMEAYKANNRTVSVVRSSSESQLSTGSYTRSLKIKDSSGAVLCTSNQVFFTVSPHTCELGLAGDSFIVDSPLQFILTSSDALPSSFSALWADSMRNVISGEDHTGLQSAVVSQAMNMTEEAGIKIEKRFSEVKENVTRAIVIKEGENVWCFSPSKRFNIIAKPVVIAPTPTPTPTPNPTPTPTPTPTPPPVVGKTYSVDIRMNANDKNTSLNKEIYITRDELTKAGWSENEYPAIDVSKSYVNWWTAGNSDCSGGGTGANVSDQERCNGSSIALDRNKLTLHADQMELSVHVVFKPITDLFNQTTQAIPIWTTWMFQERKDISLKIELGSNAKGVCTYNGETLNGYDRRTAAAPSCGFKPAQVSTLNWLVSSGHIKSGPSPSGVYELNANSTQECQFIHRTDDGAVFEMRSLGYTFVKDGSNANGYCGVTETVQEPFNFGGIPD